MLKYIERLRGESEKTRRRYAFGISLIVVLIIAGAWTANRIYLSSLPADSEIISEKNPSPVQSVLKTISAGYANVRNAIAPMPRFDLGVASTTPSRKAETPLLGKGGEAEKVAATTSPKFGEVIITDPAN